MTTPEQDGKKRPGTATTTAERRFVLSGWLPAAMVQSINAAMPAEPAPVPLSTGIVTVTPAMAASWLTRNSNNRPARHKVVDAYARDMAAGTWPFDGAPIRFSLEEILLDGQHRMAAVAISGVVLPFLVVVGLPPESQATMDTGARRSAGDALRLHGEQNASLLAAAAKVAICHDAGTLSGRNVQVTTSEVMDWIEAHPEIREHVAKTSHAGIGLDPSVAAFARWRLAQVDPAAAAEFFERLIEMRLGGTGDPLATLARRLRSAKINREKLDRRAQLFLVFRTWNAWRRREKLGQISIYSKTGGPAAIPEPL